MTVHKIIHVATVIIPKEGKKKLYLLEFSPNDYRWYQEDFKETSIFGNTIEIALRNAYHHWKLYQFNPLMCGFRYTLPERDEHGINALYYQLASSRSSPNGIYLDENVGHNCFVQNYSDEAIDLLKKLGKEVTLPDEK